jgi:hypothetical protein
MAGTTSDSRDDALGGGDADIGRDQQLFERFDRIDVDRTGTLFRRVGLLDDLFKAADDLLLRASQTLAKAI